MQKKITLIVTLILVLASVSLAQWGNQGAWPTNQPATALWKTGQNHAMAVDPDGKLWVGRYAAVAKHGVAPGDTLKKSVYLTYIFNPDGTQTSFSPIWRILGDTLLTTSRGMRLNIDGNILYVTGNTPTPNTMYLINYKTGVGVRKLVLPVQKTSAAPAVASNGTIFLAPVVPGDFPITMFDQNFTLLGTAVTGAPGFSRSFEVSKDGNTIYWAGYDKGKIYVYNRADEFSNFTLKDSIMNGAKAESFTWRPGTNQLWISGGSQNDQPTRPYTKGTWYAYDVTQKKVVDSLKWQWKDWTSEATKAERPRALAFTPDGKTAYIGSFGTGTADLVQKVVLGAADIKKLEEIPSTFSLEQNYPNPFNPTTTIKFSLPVEGMVSLKVYDVVGQEIETLLDTYKGAGTYEINFDASKLSSGLYIYTLATEKQSISKKMILVK